MRKILYAWDLFRSVRRNLADGFSACHELRFVCRYHCLVEDKGWDIRWRFQRPESNEDFVLACDTCLHEMEYLYKEGLFDSLKHYFMCHRILMELRLLANQMPRVWWLAFHLPIK